MIPFPKATILLALAGLLALPSCSTISALSGASQPLEVYELRTPQVRPFTGRQRTELIIEEPIASGALATDRIMIRPARLQAQYLPDARWSDDAPIMLQTLMVRSLTETGAFASVGRAPVGSLADYALLSELTDFQAETTGPDGTATVRIRLVVRLVRERDARVIASQTFEATALAPSTETGAIVAAFDAATARLLPELTDWVSARTRGS